MIQNDSTCTKISKSIGRKCHQIPKITLTVVTNGTVWNGNKFENGKTKQQINIAQHIAKIIKRSSKIHGPLPFRCAIEHMQGAPEGAAIELNDRKKFDCWLELDATSS